MVIMSIIFSIFLSLVIIAGGFMCKSVANEKIDDCIGYRTKLSKKNADTWKEANTYGGKVLIACGMIYFGLSIVVTVIFFNRQDVVFITNSVAMLPIILIGVYISERYLKSIFDSDGNRK